MLYNECIYCSVTGKCPCTKPQGVNIAPSTQICGIYITNVGENYDSCVYTHGSLPGTLHKSLLQFAILRKRGYESRDKVMGYMYQGVLVCKTGYSVVVYCIHTDTREWIYATVETGC